MTRMVLALTSLLLAQVSVTQALPPNFVLILTDDQGWTSTSVQLDPNEPDSMSDFYQTVRLEELASQGHEIQQRVFIRSGLLADESIDSDRQEYGPITADGCHRRR